MNQMVDDLVSVVDWEGVRVERDWERIETELGTALPGDFKALQENFHVNGAFCTYLALLPVESDGLTTLTNESISLRVRVHERPGLRSLYEPYGVFEPTQPGLIQWGNGVVTEDQYFWLADSGVSPEGWPIIARTSPLDEWFRFEMSTSEFIYRVLTDEQLEPFSIASDLEKTYFEIF